MDTKNQVMDSNKRETFEGMKIKDEINFTITKLSSIPA